MYGIDVAMQLLRPGAKWEISNTMFTRWEDPRPCPSWEEVVWVMDKIREFEDSIPTVWLPEQLEKMKNDSEEFDKAVA
jgi:tRNA uridine 5-carbamoylmethylation protein Kti12